MSIKVPTMRAPVDTCFQPPIDVHPPPSGDACAAGMTQDFYAQGVLVKEGICLAKAIEAAYEEAAPPLSSNKGKSSLLLCHVSVCTRTPYTCDYWLHSIYL